MTSGRISSSKESTGICTRDKEEVDEDEDEDGEDNDNNLRNSTPVYQCNSRIKVCERMSFQFAP